MEHYRLRKYRGPETWAKVREAYVAGEPAQSVALRFDVGLANIRKKASREGWTRNAMAQRYDLKPGRGAPDGPRPAIGRLPDVLNLSHEPDERPVKVSEAVERAGARAAWLLSEGRATEAEALISALHLDIAMVSSVEPSARNAVHVIAVAEAASVAKPCTLSRF